MRLRKTSRGIAAALALVVVVALPSPAAGDAGIATYKSKSDDPNGMKAKTFFDLLDSSLGNKFNSAVLVLGGCFTSDFTSKAKTSTVGISGKPVAVLAATSEGDTTACAGGTQLGNSFTNGVTSGFGQSGATAEDAFNQGQTSAGRSPVQGQTPTFTALGGGGTIKLGEGAASYHAILFSGKPQTCADWNDVDKIYKELRNKGYPAANIQTFFGNGTRGGGAGDNTPQILNDDFTKKKTVKEGFNDGDCPSFTDQGETIKAATYDNLKKALQDLKAVADAGANEQYFIWAADHSTLLAVATPSSRNCDTALCSSNANLDQSFFAQHATDEPGVVMTPGHFFQPNHQVFCNGQPIGFLNPALQGELQFFPVGPGVLSPGNNVIQVSGAGEPVQLDDIAFTTGEVPIVFGIENIPTLSMAGAVGLAGLLAAGAVVALRRRRS